MLEIADGISTAMAVKPRIDSGRISMASIAILTSLASIFLPRYSGVRPTISPAMNTAMIDEQQHAVKAGADAAENDLTELDRCSIGIMPPSGVKLSCIELTEPFEAAVVATAHRLELAMPKRTSLPSMLRRIDAETREIGVAGSLPPNR